MRGKGITVICGILLIFPWTLLILRTNAWALESPVGEILIGAYGAAMIGGGILNSIAYGKWMIKNSFMKVCLVVNLLYAVCGAAALVMMAI